MSPCVKGVIGFLINSSVMGRPSLRKAFHRADACSRSGLGQRGEAAFDMISRAWCVTLLLLAACSGTNDALHGRIRTTSGDFAVARGSTSRTPEQLGMLRFLYDDLGGLRIENGHATALPGKVLVAALVRDRSARLGTPTTPDEATAAFAEFGFVSADSIANWRGPQPARVPGHPIGVVTGTADHSLPSLRVEIANISCGACHVGFVYDSTGAPTRTAWVGMANTSIDVSGFSSAVYRNLKASRGREAEFLATIDTLFPNIDGRERRTLQKYVLPSVAK